MHLNRKKAVGNAILGAILLGALLALVYLVSLRHFVRADLTDDQVFTLSSATKDVVARVAKYPLRITGYFSERVPKTLKPQIDWIKDLLKEYDAFGKGNLHVAFVDPGSKDVTPSEKDNIEKGFGVHPVELREMARDRFEAVQTYLSIVLVYGDKHERIDLFDQKEPLLDTRGTVPPSSLGFEYVLTRTILKVSQDDLRGVGIIADASTPPPKQGQPDPGTGYRFLTDVLDKQYRVRNVDLKSGTPVPDDIETLLIVKPKNLTEREAFEIDQFVMRGGKLIVFADHYDVDLTQGGVRTKPITTGIDALLENFGFRLGESMVADSNCGSLLRQSQQGIIRMVQPIPYPFLVWVVREGMDSQNPIVSRLSMIQLPWVCPIELIEDRLKDKEVQRLIRSAPTSWTATDAPFVEYQDRPTAPSGATTGSHVLAAVAIGKFSSLYAGKPIPKPEAAEKPKKRPGEPDMPDLSEEIAKRDAERPVIASSPETRVLVVGSGAVISDQMLGSQQTGPMSQSLLLNSVDWFTLGDELIRIRSRGIENRALTEIPDARKGLIRWANILGMPVILLIFWLFRTIYRGRAAARYLKAGA